MEYKIGLSEEEVWIRRQRGEGGYEVPKITKSTAAIVRENVCTLFNLLNFIIAVLLLIAGAYTNLLFIFIILLNIIIGIAQELKAKKLVDDLSILNRPVVSVIREGEQRDIELEEVVKDDIMVLESGKQICSDAVVLDGVVEVDESLLTGESDPVVKRSGSVLYSGSSVISGKAYSRVTHAGNDNYAAKLVEEVKEEKKIHSELLDSMQKVTRFTSMLIVPLGVLLFFQAAFLRNAEFHNSIVSSAAALLGMLPKGLVLLISVSLAAGVIRLAKMKILIQNIYSLETLAHVDVLCLDKTGTITDGQLSVKNVIRISGLDVAETDHLIRSYLAASDDNNATFQAIKEAFGAEEVYQAVNKISFSSQRKWGCVSFEGIGSIFVGAPDRLLQEIPENLRWEMQEGRRAIVIAYSKDVWENDQELPGELRPLCSVILEDHIRKNAKEALEFFEKEGVNVKVISGDHKATVSTIAKKAGLKNWHKVIDLSQVGEDADFISLCKKYSVFARVTPRQKQLLVKALQECGHQVAMTGDGVNDLLALRESDCAIAIADGSDASRQIAEVVLLDSDFTNLPQVVMEGRAVVHNVTRTAGVFFIKTIYSVLVSVLCLALNVPFPFIPIQITLVDACIEAYPSFLTILESDVRKIKGSFLKKVLRNALPFAVVIAGMIGVISVITPFGPSENQTVMYLLLIIVSMTAVIKSCLPMNRLRAVLCITMVFGTFFGVFLLKDLLQISTITPEMCKYTLSVFFVLEAVLFGLHKMQSLTGKHWKNSLKCDRIDA